MPIKSCRGEEKRKRLAQNYIITPISHLHLLPGQEKSGCGGKLTRRYYAFDFENKKNSEDKGAFLAGYICGESFLKLIGHPPIPLFDPLRTVQEQA